MQDTPQPADAEVLHWRKSPQAAEGNPGLEVVRGDAGNFPGGGMSAFKDYILALICVIPASGPKRMAMQGRVTVQFVVDKMEVIKDLKVPCLRIRYGCQRPRRMSLCRSAGDRRQKVSCGCGMMVPVINKAGRRQT